MRCPKVIKNNRKVISKIFKLESLFLNNVERKRICPKRKLHANFPHVSTFYLCLFSINQIRLRINRLFVFPSFYHVAYLPLDFQTASWKTEKYSLKNYICRLHFLSDQHHYIVLHQAIYIVYEWFLLIFFYLKTKLFKITRAIFSWNCF